MMKIRKNIQSWYPINLIEGEGVGTAYEYYAKLRKLRKFISSIGHPKRILIAGLPEKYGFSMDFFWLGGMLHAETVVTDERSEALERARKVLSKLISDKHINETKFSFIKTDKILEFNKLDVTKRGFDLALSSEVFQRLDTSKDTYISNLVNVAKNFAIFVPNRGNESHASLSGLKSVWMEELLRHCQEHSKTRIYDYGYIDMPPFPPGLSRSQEKREQAANSPFETFLIKALGICNICEDITPKFIKAKFAHITYIMVKNR